MNEQSNITFILAHPDDEHIPFGLPRELAEKGYSVNLIALTNGDLGSHSLSSRRKIARIRRKEFEESAQIIGAHAQILGFHDGELPFIGKKAGRRLLKELRLLQPDVVIIPSSRDYHLDHVATHDIAQWALFNLPAKPIATRRGIFRKRIPPHLLPVSVYEMDTQGSQTWTSTTEDTGENHDTLSSVNTIFPISESAIEKSMNAFWAHKSQLGPRADGQISYPELARLGARRRGQQAGFSYGVGLNFIPFGGYAFSTNNILAAKK